MTLGEIQDVNDGGEAFDISLKYEYLVNGEKFERTVEISSNDKNNFKRWWSKDDWSEQFVWVLYSNEQPNESLVKLSRIYSMEDTISILRPMNYDGFY